MNKKIIKSMLSVSGIVLLGKILGFIKQMITANAFGATIETDLISLSEGFISNIDYLLIQALSTAFIPTYIHLKNEDESKSKTFVSNTIKFFLILTFGISIVLFATSPLVSKILAPSYSAELSYKLTKYIKILSPVLIIIVEMAVFSSLLKANERFVPSELMGFNQSVILIVLILALGKIIGPDILIIGFFAYAVFNLIFLMFHSRKMWHITKGNPFSDVNVKKLLAMMGPLLLGYSIVFVNQQVDKIIVSGLGEGTITAMGYAAVLSNFITTFVGSICGVMFTYVTQKIAIHDDKEAAQLTASSITQMMVVLLPISILTIINSKDIVSIVFGRGKFDERAINNCSKALIGYGLVFVPFIIRELLSRLQYAYGESKRPMINSSLAIVINIVLSFILSRFIGVLGVTIATSISVAFCAAFNYFSSRKYNKYVKIITDNKSIINMIIGSVLCIIISLINRSLLANINQLIRFIITCGISLSLYLVINRNSLKLLINSLKKKK